MILKMGHLETEKRSRRFRSKDFAGAAALEVESQDAEKNQDDPTGHDQRIDGQEEDVEQGLFSGCVEGEEKVGYRLPKRMISRMMPRAERKSTSKPAPA